MEDRVTPAKAKVYVIYISISSGFSIGDYKYSVRAKIWRRQGANWHTDGTQHMKKAGSTFLV